MSDDSPTTQLNVRVPRQLALQLKQAARTDGECSAVLVRRLLKLGLAQLRDTRGAEQPQTTVDA